MCQFSEVAHHPTTLWVSVAKASFSHELLLADGRFSLAVLQERQAAWARACGLESGRSCDKAAELPLYREKDSVHLDGALSSIVCRVTRTVDVDDHTLFLADILSAKTDTRNLSLRHLLTTDL